MYKCEMVDKRVLVTAKPEDCIINQLESTGWEFIQALPYSLPYVILIFKQVGIHLETPVKATVASSKEEINSLTGK